VLGQDGLPPQPCLFNDGCFVFLHFNRVEIVEVIVIVCIARATAPA
jgi:hypothetical protein